jgi:hypothetical protein
VLEGYRQNVIDKLWVRYWCWVGKYLKKNVRFDESYYVMRMMRRVLANVDFSGYDIIFVPTDMCIMTALPQRVKSKLVHLVDAPVQSLFEYYTEFSNLTLQNRFEASMLTRKAFRRADLIVASSDWCKCEAVRHCGVSPDKIAVVEFGANIDAKDIPAGLTKRLAVGDDPLNVYWSGVNWVRKGGAVAFDCCRELIARGIDVRFHITGMRQLPDEVSTQPWVVNYGFLNKNIPTEYHKLIDIMSQQHIFLFPSRAECSSIALCEANAFGLPCYVYDTGGTANYVENSYNGYMLPLTASGRDFADKIVDTLSDYERLSVNARKKYETSLNWSTWSSRVAAAINALFLY